MSEGLYSNITKTPVKIVKNYQMNDENSIHTGIDIRPSIHDRRFFKVYSACAGVVTFIGKDEYNHFAVVVEYNANTCVRYTYLHSHNLELGQAIKGEDLIGQADRFVHVELGKRVEENGKQRFPLYIYKVTYERINPISVVDGSADFFMATDEEMKRIEEIMKEDSEQIAEFPIEKNKEVGWVTIPGYYDDDTGHSDEEDLG